MKAWLGPVRTEPVSRFWFHLLSVVQNLLLLPVIATRFCSSSASTGSRTSAGPALNPAGWETCLLSAGSGSPQLHPSGPDPLDRSHWTPGGFLFLLWRFWSFIRTPPSGGFQNLLVLLMFWSSKWRFWSVLIHRFLTLVVTSVGTLVVNFVP